MVVVLGPNLAVDRTLAVPHFRAGQIFRTSRVRVVPGGKGANVARALKALGERPHLVGLVAGWTGRFIREGLAREGIEATLVETPGLSRTCTIVVDPSDGTATVVNEEGDLHPDAGQLRHLYETLVRLAGQARAVVCSGSLPPALPADFYRPVLAAARRAGALAVLDTSGRALSEGLQAPPDLIKPNEEELAGLVGAGPRPLGLDEVAGAARRLVEGGVPAVVASLAARGAVAACAGGIWVARPPRVPVVDPIGAGDSMVAAMTWALLQGSDLPEAVALGVAAGAADAATLGAGVITREAVEALRREVEIQRIEP